MQHCEPPNTCADLTSEQIMEVNAKVSDQMSMPATQEVLVPTDRGIDGADREPSIIVESW